MKMGSALGSRYSNACGLCTLAGFLFLLRNHWPPIQGVKSIKRGIVIWGIDEGSHGMGMLQEILVIYAP